ncbi:cupin domain-containing protein [Streptomyces sp. NPDC050535]|uniref:cupin domain-containing protein n=1 Tax=Streptomyces sp. NPDC050535 TaxID=3365626 RepID=UPI0037B1F2DA
MSARTRRPTARPRQGGRGVFILEGDFVFTVGDEEIPAGPGSYIYLPPKVRHGFRVESEVGRVYNMLTPAGFEQNIITKGQPAPPGLDAPTGNERRAAMEAIAYLQAPSPLGRPCLGA